MRRRIRVLTLVVIVGLVVSGATALPLEWELTLAARALGAEAGAAPATNSSLTRWIVRVRDGLKETYAKHPFVAYGTDWLAFGHFVIAIAFIGAWRDPVRNAWLFTFGLVACSLVVPYALVLGALRGLPIYWRLIDGSFGVAGFVPLWCCRRYVQELERGCGGAQARPGGSNRAGRNPTAG